MNTPHWIEQYYLKLWGLLGYVGLTLAAPYYLLRMLATPRYRPGLRERLTFLFPEKRQLLQEGSYIWIHTVSVGELQAARPLLVELKRRFPAFKILVSTVTPTGQDLARSLSDVDLSIYLPIDLYPLCRRVLAWTQPVCVLIMETELWPNFLRAAAGLNIPLFLINARLSDQSFRRYRKFRPLFAPLLALFHRILAQSDADAYRFLQIGAPASRVTPAGNIKFDAAAIPDDPAVREKWRRLFQIDEKEILLVAGSTFPGEEALLFRIVEALRLEGYPLRLVIAPRHVERVNAILDELKKYQSPLARRSALDPSAPPADPGTVILLDTIGELRHVYAAADIVFIGKSMRARGGQNPIEPAAWGKPVIFGKNMQNFRDTAAMLLREEAAFQAANEAELLSACRRFCQDPALGRRMGERARETVKKNQGALQTIVQWIQPVLEVDQSA
ncbi:MAG: 3-deoxy-D-manno-octulosonic acid transferase [Candidatus Omnitrophica bacterium]|nr:3-deoxy-D-manno-octulosonic acid transferase [Candidatus Omnitrophota bacterium]